MLTERIAQNSPSLPFYQFFISGEGKLTNKDGSIYEGSFHKHRRHGEGKWILRFDNANANIVKINLGTP